MSHDKLIRAGRKRPLFEPGETTVEVQLGRSEIERMVPHRAPFLLIEGIDAVDLPRRAVRGFRTVDPADPVLAGHFPGDPVYPGVLLLETMAQLSICLQHFCNTDRVTVLPDDQPPRLRLLRVHHALFMAEARPGDRLTVIGQTVDDNGYTATLAGQVLKGDGTICTVSIMEAVLLDEQ